jgi:hypothetical protein
MVHCDAILVGFGRSSTDDTGMIRYLNRHVEIYHDVGYEDNSRSWSREKDVSVVGTERSDLWLLRYVTTVPCERSYFISEIL